MIEQISLKLIDAHPDNPRLELREEVIASIQAQIHQLGFQEMHAVILRRLGKRYQTIDGHHRVDAAQRAGLKTIPAWVMDYTDEEAYMQLALANAQSGLTPLEYGKHALMATTKYGKNGGTSIAKYAGQVVREEQTVRHQIWAYEVYGESKNVFGLDQKFIHLVIIHAAPPHLWKELAQRMVDEGWTVAMTKAEVKKVQPPKAPKAEPKALITKVTSSQWKEMSKQQQADVTNWRGRYAPSSFPEEKTDWLECARRSHDPVTGCGHNCPEGSEPTLHLDRLNAPHGTAVPSMDTHPSYGNVLICSMSDLFDKLVPDEWIHLVLQPLRENPQWNFLFLTRFPERMAEFDEFPDNAWVGTTVDLQARVRNAERAMQMLKAKKKWLSCEPMLEPLRFEDLSIFQWVVIGGVPKIAASTVPMPDWKPPRRWVWDLTFRAWDAGCKVYHKANLNHARLKQFPYDPSPIQEPDAPPEVFQYLKVIEGKTVSCPPRAED